jgi:hypothetical protein
MEREKRVMKDTEGINEERKEGLDYKTRRSEKDRDVLRSVGSATSRLLPVATSRK